MKRPVESQRASSVPAPESAIRPLVHQRPSGARLADRNARRRDAAGDEPGLTARPVELEGIGPDRTVGRDLEVEVVIAGIADLGAAREAGLKQQRCRIGG